LGWESGRFGYAGEGASGRLLGHLERLHPASVFLIRRSGGHRRRPAEDGTARSPADIEVDPAGAPPTYPKSASAISPGPFHDAAHDRNLHALEMPGLLPDALRWWIAGRKRAPAGWTGDIFGLRDAGAGALEKMYASFAAANRIGLRFPRSPDRPRPSHQQAAGEETRFRSAGRENEHHGTRRWLQCCRIQIGAREPILSNCSARRGRLQARVRRPRRADGWRP